MPRTIRASAAALTAQSSCILRPPLARFVVFSIVSQAGWPIWPLLALSVAALAIIFERLLSLQTKRIIPPELTTQVLQLVRAQADDAQALDKLKVSSPLGRILAQLLLHRTLPDAELRRSVEDVGQDVAFALNRYLAGLALIATVAPLMGLFGTVIGMIEIFGAQTPTGGATGGNPAQLAHGISVALYNTAFGLIVAIPSLIFWRYFRARVDGLLLTLELASERLVRQLNQLRR